VRATGEPTVPEPKSVEVPAEIALPLKVTVKVLRAAGPALFAEKVIVPIDSGFALLCEVPPMAAVLAVSAERKTVCALPVAPDTEETVTVRFEVAPKAVTEVVEATKKVLAVLSDAPFDAKVAASPFKVNEIELA